MLHVQWKKFLEPAGRVMFFFRDKLKNKVSTLATRQEKLEAECYDRRKVGRFIVIGHKIDKNKLTNKRLVMNLPETSHRKICRG